MARTDRRRTPRMTVSDLAYVNLDADNGGTILNISEGGLSFQARAPIRKTERIRFWYSYRRRRVQSGGAGSLEIQATGISRFIEVSSELAWTDETQKKGGLRFINLPTEARQQIRDWICQPELVTVKPNVSPVPRKSPFLVAIRPSPNAIPEALDKLMGLLRRIRSIRLWRGFSVGLLVGVLVTGSATSMIYFASHGRELGDSLIRIGERLGGKSGSKVSVAEARQKGRFADAGAPSAQTVMPELMKGWEEAKTAEPEPQPSEPVRESAKAKAPSTRALAANIPVRENPTPTLPGKDPVTLAASVRAASSDHREIGSVVQLASSERTIVRADAPSGLGQPTSTMEIEPAKTVAVDVEAPKGKNVEEGSEKYLEIGRFKEKLLAAEKTEQLTDLGFHSTIVPRSRFFGKAYEVLVGPYGDDQEAEAAHKSLASHGFTPRSYERGKRDFVLPHSLVASGKRLPTGYCVISWESYLPDAVVKIEDERNAGVTLDAKWVNRAVGYTQNAVAYQINKDGTRTLVEIRFSGMQQALVFGGK